MAADQWSGLFQMKWQKLNSLSLLGIEPLLSSPNNSVFWLKCNSSRHDMCTECIVTAVLQIRDQLSVQKTQNIIQQNAQSSGTSHLEELCSSSVLDLWSISTCFTSWLHYWLSWIYRSPYSPNKSSDIKFRQAMTTSSQIHPHSAIKIIFPYHHTLYKPFTWRNTIK